jgi:hypothetical protein
MRISTAIEFLAHHFASPQTAGIPVYMQGPPGVGKTDLGYEVAAKLHIPRERVIIIRPSLMDPVDFMGVPAVSDGCTTWNPPKWLHDLREGRWLLVIDEAPQAVVMLQNALGGLVLDRFIGGVHLSPDVYIYMTGNRVEDKAGANKMVTQLGNRIMLLNMDVSMKDWVTWARENGIDPMLITFIIWRDSKSEPVLFDFDPNRISNATPRSWAKVSLIDTTLPLDVYTEMTSGLVGQGRALEYIAFRKHVDSLPDYQVIMADPDNAPIPPQIEVKYAASGWLADKADAKTFPNLLRYIQRMPLDYQVLFVKIASKRDAGIMATRAFVEWVGRNSAAFTTAP